MHSIQNQLLSALPIEEYKRLLPNLELVFLPLKQIIYAANQPIEYVYFPNDGIISLVNRIPEGRTLEVATVGHEGMVGIPVLLGGDRIVGQAVVQVVGNAWRMKVDDFKRQVTPSSHLHSLLLRYTLALMNSISQSLACNCFHSVEQRCCRWLLMCQDRVGADCFVLTQEFLAQMLGIHRPTVSGVASALQQAGLIHYSRGKVTICDRSGLEAIACKCYWLIEQEFESLLKQDVARSCNDGSSNRNLQ